MKYCLIFLQCFFICSFSLCANENFNIDDRSHDFIDRDFEVSRLWDTVIAKRCGDILFLGQIKWGELLFTGGIFVNEETIYRILLIDLKSKNEKNFSVKELPRTTASISMNCQRFSLDNGLYELQDDKMKKIKEVKDSLQNLTVDYSGIKFLDNGRISYLRNDSLNGLELVVCDIKNNKKIDIYRPSGTLENYNISGNLLSYVSTINNKREAFIIDLKTKEKSNISIIRHSSSKKLLINNIDTYLNERGELFTINRMNQDSGSSYKGWFYIILDSKGKEVTDFHALKIQKSKEGIYAINNSIGGGSVSITLHSINDKKMTPIKVEGVKKLDRRVKAENVLILSSSIMKEEVVSLKNQNLNSLYKNGNYQDLANHEILDLEGQNRKLPATILIPKINKPKSIVIFLHGGGFNGHGYGAGDLNAYDLNLLDADNIIYKINTYGDYFPDASYDSPSETRSIMQWGGDEIEDIAAAYDQMRERYPDLPIILMGFSHGAYLTSLMGTRYAEKRNFSAYIPLFGVWDLSIEDRNGNMATKGRLALSDRHFHDPGNLRAVFTYDEKIINENGLTSIRIDKKITIEAAKIELQKIRAAGNDVDYLYFDLPASYYERRNPLVSLDKVIKPFLVIHGGQDLNVSSNHQTLLLKNLSEDKKSLFEAVIYADEGHGVFLRDNAIDFQERLLNFVKKIQLPKEHGRS